MLNCLHVHNFSHVQYYGSTMIMTLPQMILQIVSAHDHHYVANNLHPTLLLTLCLQIPGFLSGKLLLSAHHVKYLIFA
jgi:hypothetical protein